MRVLDNGRLSGGRRVEDVRGLIDGILFLFSTRFIMPIREGIYYEGHMAGA
jgi:hypothetical protein